MKLAAIYNIFDGVELLKGSMKQLDGHVDLFILVYQTKSNFGEKFYGFDQLNFFDIQTPIHKHLYEPTVTTDRLNTGAHNEKLKRQLGIDLAKAWGFTHFLHVDCDEYYHDFGAAKQEYASLGNAGSVCRLFTYFKKPTWRIATTDNYYVPFIHRIDMDTITGVDEYPFYVDPTRRINQWDVGMMETAVMHHYSYIRKDIEMKIRNSSARRNIERSNLLEEYNRLQLDEEAEGYLMDHLGGHNLTVVENLFDIQI